MGEIAVRQAIVHAVVAAAVVEAVLRAWNVRRAESRLRFWLLALAFPLLVLPLFLAGFPLRRGDWFAAAWALFASQRWNAVRVGGIGVDSLAFAGLAAAGTLLFLRDAVPFLRAAVRDWRQGADPSAEAPRAIVELACEVAREVGASLPTITVLATPDDVVFVRGAWRPTLVLSDGVLAHLSDAQLRAALAHELAHVRSRDPLAGWVLMVARLVMFWNPAVQLVARAVVEEMERRADRVAASSMGAPAFAEALRVLASPGPVRPGTPAVAGTESPGSVHPAPARVPSRRRIEVLADRFHGAHITSRVEAVLAHDPAPPFEQARLVAVAAALGTLLFFVV